MIRKIKSSLLNAVIILTASTSLFGFTALANNDTVTVGDFTYERSSETVGGRDVETWIVIDYHGSDTEVIIPDAIDAETSEEILDVGSSQLQENLLAGNIITEVSNSAFSGSNVESVKLPGYLMKAKSDLFDEADQLREISGAGKLSSSGFNTDGTALYNGNTLFVFPKGYTGTYEVKENTNKYSSNVFSNTSLDKLVLKGDISYGSSNDYNRSIFVGAVIGEVELDGTGVDEKTFLGAQIGILSGTNTSSGSLVKNNELLYFGFESDLDFTSISSISSLAFQTEALYKEVEAEISDSIKEITVFRFYNGSGSAHTQRYFRVDGKTAFCYDYGKENPEIVGELLDYDITIEPDTEKYNQIRALLYGGVPNNGDGLFEEVFGKEYDELSYGLSGDAAKNAVGALVWEVVSGKTVDIDGIYGIDSDKFTKSDIKTYVNQLRSRYVDKADGFDLSEFELGFYQSQKPASAQRLVVINEIYRQDTVEPKKPSVSISKKDITTKEELPGATLKVVKNGVIIDEWVSANTPHIIDELEDGAYELIEITAPKGYLVAESITFTVIDGELSSSNIVMYDMPEDDNDLYISKRDITTGEELPGAKLVLKCNDEVIAQWTSTNEPYKLTNLKDGEYLLTEVLAPKGYEIAESITFTIQDGKSDVSLVIMYDEPSLATSSDAKPSKPGINGNYSGSTDSGSTDTETSAKTPITEITTPTIEVPDEPRPLPVTGDIGGVVKVMAGMLAVMALGYLVKRRTDFKFKL